ncbi:MAG: glycosyltransferase family 39 protein, partial [Anaerolineae bacterium]|nr:glycosyltransferase family 39 protein [Anaerolineae bacterium]
MLNLPALKTFNLTARTFTLIRLFLLLFYIALLLHSHAFSLPYIDHPEEPAFYLAGQQQIGKFELGDYMRGYPPAYIWLELFISQRLEALGFSGISHTVNVMRWIAIAISAGTLWLIFSAAREAAGDWASLVAGITWISSPLVVSNAVVATPDPLVYFTVACTLWLSILAVRRGRPIYVVLATIISAFAILVKFTFVPALLAVVAGISVWLRDRDSGTHLLVNQLDIAVVTAFLVIGVFRLEDPSMAYRDLSLSAQIKAGQQLGKPQLPVPASPANENRVLNNIGYVALPTNTGATLLWLLSGAVAWLLARSARIDWRIILLCLIAIGAVPLIAASFRAISLQRIYEALPATVALCVLLGIATVQVWRALPNKPVFSRLYMGAVALWLILVILPNLGASLATVYERGFPDRRIEVRRWAEATLEDGWIAMPNTYERAFDPIWGGIQHTRWLDFLVYDHNFTDKPLTYWRDERGMLHAIVPLETAQRPENQEYFAQLLRLKTFANPPYRRGDEVVVYRTIPIQTPLEATFGDQIKLIGMDFEPSDDAVRMRLYWQPLRPIQIAYSLYVHLSPLDSRQVLAQQDSAPKAGRPTFTWQDTNEVLVGD